MQDGTEHFVNPVVLILPRRWVYTASSTLCQMLSSLGCVMYFSSFGVHHCNKKYIFPVFCAAYLGGAGDPPPVLRFSTTLSVG